MKPAEICEWCTKHVLGTVCSSSCDRCLPIGQLLKTCVACKHTRYCSKACQKAHWPEHKRACRVAVDLNDTRKDLGEGIEAKHKSFERWCTNTGPFAQAAVSALGLHSDFKRIDKYVFLVNVITAPILTGARLSPGSTNAKFKINFTHSIKSARCASMEEMHALLDWRFPDGAAGTEFVLAHHPGLMRIYFINHSFPYPLDGYTTPIDMTPSDLQMIPYDPDWLAHLHYRLDPKEG